MDPLISVPRADILASFFSLRVSDRAWKDLGFRSTAARNLPEATPDHELLKKFFNECADPERIDRGELIRQIRHPRIFRIRSGHWRAAVWFDHDGAVLWMLRALSLAKFPVEDRLYDEFASLEERKQLLPSTEELLVARGGQYVGSLIASLAAAVVAAYREPGSWQPAVCTRPDGSAVRAGRVYLERDEELVTQYVVVAAHAFGRDDIVVPSDWRVTLFDALFDGREAVQYPRSLPAGAALKDGETPLMQVRAEERPPAWLDS